MAWPARLLKQASGGAEGFLRGNQKPWRGGIVNIIDTINNIIGARGINGGVCEVGDDGRIPSFRMPVANPYPAPAPPDLSRYMLTSARGAPNGVASLGAAARNDTPRLQMSQAPSVWHRGARSGSSYLTREAWNTIISTPSQPGDVFLLQASYLYGPAATEVSNLTRFRVSWMWVYDYTTEFFILPAPGAGAGASLAIRGHATGSRTQAKVNDLSGLSNQRLGARIEGILQIR